MSPPRLLAAGRRALARVAAAARGRASQPGAPSLPAGAVPPLPSDGAAVPGPAGRGRRDGPTGAAPRPLDPAAVPRFDDEHDRAVLSGF